MSDDFYSSHWFKLWWLFSLTDTRIGTVSWLPSVPLSCHRKQVCYYGFSTCCVPKYPSAYHSTVISIFLRVNTLNPPDCTTFLDMSMLIICCCIDSLICLGRVIEGVNPWLVIGFLFQPTSWSSPQDSFATFIINEYESTKWEWH